MDIVISNRSIRGSVCYPSEWKNSFWEVHRAFPTVKLYANSKCHLCFICISHICYMFGSMEPPTMWNISTKQMTIRWTHIKLTSLISSMFVIYSLIHISYIESYSFHRTPIVCSNPNCALTPPQFWVMRCILYRCLCIARFRLLNSPLLGRFINQLNRGVFIQRYGYGRQHEYCKNNRSLFTIWKSEYNKSAQESQENKNGHHMNSYETYKSNIVICLSYTVSYTFHISSHVVFIEFS